MKTEEIQALFSDAQAVFEPISGQPSDADITRLRDTIASILYLILYDEELGVHNLVGVILTTAEFKSKYGVTYLTPKRPEIYDATITKDTVPFERAKKEITWKVKCADYDVYSTAIRWACNFIIAVAEDTWIRELGDPISRYNDATPRAIMIHLTTTCVGIHALNVLTLQNEMQQYHTEY